MTEEIKQQYVSGGVVRIEKPEGDVGECSVEVALYHDNPITGRFDVWSFPYPHFKSQRDIEDAHVRFMMAEPHWSLRTVTMCTDCFERYSKAAAENKVTVELP